MRRSHRVPKRWLVKKRLLLVLEATTYTRIYGQQQFGKCVKYFRMFSVYEKYFYNENKANYGNHLQDSCIKCMLLT